MVGSSGALTTASIAASVVGFTPLPEERTSATVSALQVPKVRYPQPDKPGSSAGTFRVEEDRDGNIGTESVDK
jgi:hypothetical protein